MPSVLIPSPENAKTKAVIAEGSTKIALEIAPDLVEGTSRKAVDIKKTMPEYVIIPYTKNSIMDISANTF